MMKCGVRAWFSVVTVGLCFLLLFQSFQIKIANYDQVLTEGQATSKASETSTVKSSLVQKGRKESRDNPSSTVKSSFVQKDDKFKNYYLSDVHTSKIDTETVLQNRRHFLLHKCRENMSRQKIKARKPQFFYSKAANLLCCKAPKTGSSFWGMLVLTLESLNEGQMFHRNRNKVHTSYGIHRMNVPETTGNVTKPLVVMATRNPFHRLFSVFIDKYYLLGLLGRTLSLRLKTGRYRTPYGYCGYNVTFQNFLDNVIETALTGAEMNEHFAPVSALCDVCNREYNFICKQETLSADTEFFLEKLNISTSKRDAIKNTIRANRTKDSVYSLVSSYANDYSVYKKDCPNPLAFFEKTWNAFKYQGFIRLSTPFPKDSFTPFSFVSQEVDNITTVILDVMAEETLSVRQRLEQRHFVMARAYRDIQENSIYNIQQIFQRDFELFGYPKFPPKINEII